MIALTALDVNDRTVELRYKIMNRSNRDIWICDALYERNRTLPADHETYLDEDGRTLVIRRQIEVPKQQETIAAKRYMGRYTVMHPGQEQTGSFSLGIPVVCHSIFAVSRPDVDLATRVVLRIGFYSGDLPGKILGILKLAASCGSVTPTYANFDLYLRYFPGLSISRLFGGLEGFNDFWTEGGTQIEIPHMLSAPLGDEACLEIVVDGVLIPIVHPENSAGIQEMP